WASVPTTHTRPAPCTPATGSSKTCATPQLRLPPGPRASLRNPPAAPRVFPRPQPPPQPPAWLPPPLPLSPGVAAAPPRSPPTRSGIRAPSPADPAAPETPHTLRPASAPDPQCCTAGSRLLARTGSAYTCS